eukprot:gene14256-16826_t
MNSKQLYVGLDGGGTKTLTVVVDALGNELGRCQTAGSNYHSVGEEAAREAICLGIRNAVAVASGDLSQVAHVCLGISGVDRPEDAALIGKWIDDLVPNTPYDIYNDAVVALTSGTLGVLFGCVVISGTGCIAFGIDHQGKTTRSAGWGPLLGDDGSGYQIGFDILKNVVKAKDETGPKTALTAAVLKQLEIKTEDELISWAYDPKNQGWQKFAQLAPLATECALQGDAVAIAVIDDACTALTSFISSVFKKLSFDTLDSVPLVLAGGNIERVCLISDKLKEKLAVAVPNAKPVFPACDSVAKWTKNQWGTVCQSDANNKCHTKQITGKSELSYYAILDVNTDLTGTSLEVSITSDWLEESLKVYVNHNKLANASQYTSSYPEGTTPYGFASCFNYGQDIYFSLQAMNGYLDGDFIIDVVQSNGMDKLIPKKKYLLRSVQNYHPLLGEMWIKMGTETLVPSFKDTISSSV